MSGRLELPTLTRLARAHGLQTTYTDGRGTRRRASVESVRATLAALDVVVQHPEDVADLLRSRHRKTWMQPLEPVTVAWGGRADIVVRQPASRADRSLRCRLTREDGSTRTWTIRDGRRRAIDRTQVDDVPYVALRHPLPEKLPAGYHQLAIAVGREMYQTLIIAAPYRAFDNGTSRWGVFAPLYALHSRRSWGVGDLSDLAMLMRWVDERGGQEVSTLPLLASFLGDTPFEPSPYLPVSRYFWNELFVDVVALPELQACSSARRLVESATFQHQLATLRETPLVAYRDVMAVKRRVLERLARWLAAHPGPRRDAFEEWVAGHPLAREYATFRARGEHGYRRPGTPEDPAAPAAKAPDRHPAVHYHLYAQWVADGQIRALTTTDGQRGPGLYLDYPLGVHPDGFDVWRFPHLFATHAAAGAPPDDLFAEGQNWSAPPLRPDTARLDGYGYFRTSLAHHLARCDTLRIDHVMAMHRLYWVPRGAPATDGVYVRYRADELYAVLCLESHRHRTRLVSENLGTVPRYVDRTMSRHGLGRLYVGQFNIVPDQPQPLRTVPAGALACVSTHDTPTFEGFLQGTDLEAQVAGGMLDQHDARSARRQRQRVVAALADATGEDSHTAPGKRRLLRAWLARLARSRAGLVIVSLEDLWLERHPQNLPGTTDPANWRRKTRHGLEALHRVSQLEDTLRVLAAGRLARRSRRH